MNELFSRVKVIPTQNVVRAFLPDWDGSGRNKALCPFHTETTPSFGWTVRLKAKGRLEEQGLL